MALLQRSYGAVGQKLRDSLRYGKRTGRRHAPGTVPKLTLPLQRGNFPRRPVGDAVFFTQPRSGGGETRQPGMGPDYCTATGIYKSHNPRAKVQMAKGTFNNRDDEKSCSIHVLRRMWRTYIQFRTHTNFRDKDARVLKDIPGPVGTFPKRQYNVVSGSFIPKQYFRCIASAIFVI